MPNIKHTPGPWIYEKSTKTIRSKPSNYWLATMDSWDGAIDNEANARLIAAAPDLLGALKNYPGRTVFTDTEIKWDEMRHQAILKATQN